MIDCIWTLKGFLASKFEDIFFRYHIDFGFKTKTNLDVSVLQILRLLLTILTEQVANKPCLQDFFLTFRLIHFIKLFKLFRQICFIAVQRGINFISCQKSNAHTYVIYELKKIHFFGTLSVCMSQFATFR